ncbi:MAG TPA: amino acid adenylation domain-containing protein, partial [Ktedonobacteraceae bacterium]|nr:amino acid adenylation domain-containing protein [Ktedonobacteraceae bacterium]
STRGARCRQSLSADLVARLRQLSQREGVTMFMLLTVAYQVLLARYSNQDDIAVGTVVANRAKVELENLIGFFVNTLVLRTNLSGQPRFRQVLERVRETALEAYAHQDLPFEKLVESLQPERDLSRSPLFQALIVLQNTPSVALELPELHLESLELEQMTARFDLSLLLEENADGLIARWEYNTDLFDRATIERMGAHFQVLLEGILADPDQLVSHLPLLSKEESTQVLREWNATQTNYTEIRAIHRLFEDQVERTPEAIALVFNGQKLTYRELERSANQLASLLRAKGIAAGSHVGICLQRSPALLISLLGVLKSGGAYIPLDPDYPAESLAFMIADADLSLLLSQEHIALWLQEFAPSLEILCLNEALEQATQAGIPELPQSCAGQQEAYVIYTSGSTGRPKGTMIPHEALSNFCQSMQQSPGFGAHDIVLAVTSFSFDIAALELLVPLTVGACVQLVSRQDALDGVALAELLATSRATVMQATPATWRLLLLAGWQGSSQLRILCGGEALPLELARQLQARSQSLWNMYGPTETTIWSTIAEIKEEDQRITIGRPIANTSVYILDEHFQPVPIGVPGLLYIGGAGLARGYFHLPVLTAERFTPDPFSQQPGSRLYCTGDVARYQTDGCIDYLGRQDHQVKLRGYRIELEEIEVWLRAYSDVSEAAIIVREDIPGDKQLVAYFVPHKSAGSPISMQLRDFLRKNLPDYMVPGVYVQLEKLPLTPNGKLDRRALPAPEIYRATLKTAYAAPRTTTEEMLVQIWASVLQVATIGIYDNFFESGGHSLLAMRALSAIRSVLHRDLSLQTFFTMPTIAQIAAYIQQASPSSDFTPIVSVSRERALPLSFAQQRLWFLYQLDPANPAYNMFLALRLQGPLDVTALKASLSRLVERHENLRTTFQVERGQPVQLIHPTMSFTLRQHNLVHLTPDDCQVALSILAQAEAETPFDLIQGPLLRGLLVQTEPQEHCLFLTQHHIISDAWSSEVFVGELAQMYRAHHLGQEISLPSLAIQYVDYALWQREWLQGAIRDEQVDYWREQLRNVATLELPGDNARPPVLSGQGRRVPVSLPLTLTRQIEALSQKEGVTLFMALLAAFQVLLARYSGQEDIVVGTPIANRGRSEIEPVLGLFLNTLVLRTQLGNEQTFQQLLQQVSQRCLEAYAHQDVPFEYLVEQLQPERNFSRSPLFQVMFLLQHEESFPEVIEGLRIAPLEVVASTAKFDLTLSLTRTAQGLQGWLEYSTDLFSQITIERMSANFQVLLEGIVAQMDTPVALLPLLTEEERMRELVAWNASRRDFHQQASLPAAFEAQVRRTPENVAIVYEEQPLSYRELDQQANQLAHALRNFGVGPEVRVGICLERSVELLVGLLGVLKAGGAYVPLDPAYPADRLAFMLQDAQVPLVLTQRRLLNLLPEGTHRVLCLDTQWSDVAHQPVSPLSLELIHPENAAYIIYTSGSTGRPKGVINTHRGILNRLAWGQETYSLTSQDAVLQKTPISFDISVWECFWPLTTGARLVLARPGGHQDAAYLAELISQQSISVLHFVPSMLRLWLEDPRVATCDRLRLVICSGEALSLDLQERFFACLPTVSLANLYGPTEASVEVTNWLCHSEPQGRSVPIGTPIANLQMYLLDP